jgi:hypothetical protein
VYDLILSSDKPIYNRAGYIDINGFKIIGTFEQIDGDKFIDEKIKFYMDNINPEFISPEYVMEERIIRGRDISSNFIYEIQSNGKIGYVTHDILNIINKNIQKIRDMKNKYMYLFNKFKGINNILLTGLILFSNLSVGLTLYNSDVIFFISNMFINQETRNHLCTYKKIKLHNNLYCISGYVKCYNMPVFKDKYFDICIICML